MIYNCELCNYSTDRSTNLNRHNNSAKHIKQIAQNIDKNIIINDDNHINIDGKSVVSQW
jgi:hypothetical protein